MFHQPHIALVTGATMAKPDPETHLLVDALAQLGLGADVLPWNSAQDWAAYPLVVVRTPWDYFRHLDAFMAWTMRTSALTQLVNPTAVIAWNSHKCYLRELAAGGIATVPTLWFERGAPTPCARLTTQGWDVVVVKPAVSIGAIGALRSKAADPACCAHLEHLVAAGDVMVQPFVRSIVEAGEVSLIYFGGVFSHAICKRPAAGDYRVQDMYGGSVHAHTPTAAERSLAEAVLEHAPAATTYARVDLVRHEGRPVLMELEAIEPELFLGATPDAAANFAAELARQLAAAQGQR
ncbi:hypothetical protein F2Q65_18530 [Thiohalocapsa marina]|uniref:Prokaryotic glutathione synthetase ATP-binding domain-containing protein n=1 Tax=Thiohalocapsa marina TaxID=424902 RepID=A0A5M8FBH5_9GAMM|nr:hypothetical protein [Thiohalocapsa marina]KAA6182057.1 hypothetical protein F2Q65_18530 [Thiohalocapsa marina]